MLLERHILFMRHLYYTSPPRILPLLMIR